MLSQYEKPHFIILFCLVARIIKGSYYLGHYKPHFQFSSWWSTIFIYNFKFILLEVLIKAICQINIFFRQAKTPLSPRNYGLWILCLKSLWQDKISMVIIIQPCIYLKRCGGNCIWFNLISRTIVDYMVPLVDFKKEKEKISNQDL